MKLVILGDAAIGKTRMLNAFLKEEAEPEKLPEDLEILPTAIESYSYNDFTIIDTSGTECYSTLRANNCRNADAFILCFSIKQLFSFQNIFPTWVKELKSYHVDQAPIILVGLHANLRQTTPKHVTEESAKKLLTDLRNVFANVSYFECSLQNLKEVNKIFETAFTLAHEYVPKKPIYEKLSQELLPQLGFLSKNNQNTNSPKMSEIQKRILLQLQGGEATDDRHDQKKTYTL